MPTYYCPCQTAISASNALFNLKKAKDLSCDSPEQTEAVTVEARTVKPNNDAYRTHPWLYLVTFRPETGESFQLEVTEDQYKQLKEGANLSVTRQGSRLVRFVIDLG